MEMRLFISLCFLLLVIFSYGEAANNKIKVGKPHRDPLVNNEKEGKKIADKKPKTDAKVSDYGNKEKEKLKKGEKSNNNKMNQYETGPSPAFPESPSTSDVTAHESEVNGCRDHPLANCNKCNKACYGPEHETYLYSYCRKSCGFCNEKTSTFHNYWRLRANSSFQPTWMLKDIEFYHEVGSSFNLANNASHAYASSEYAGFLASYAFDGKNETAWYPANYGTHDNNDDWIGYEFPIGVRVHGVRIHNDEGFPGAAPQTILVEASDEKNPNSYDTKWVIHNTNTTVADQSYQVHECPVLWKKHYDSEYTAWCYRLFAQPKTFEEASSICEEEGAQLASVLSNDQRNFILKDVKVCVKAWIGLRKEDKAYYWVDGSDSSYHNWKDEHYTESQRENDECVLIDEEGRWELERCEDKNYFICKQKLYIKPPSKPEEVPSPLPYEPEIPPLIFYAPDVTEPVANTKHIPQGVFPDKDGKFPDGSDSSDSESKTLSAILYKQSLKHLDEIKGQKPQVGTKPEQWEDPTPFALKIDAIAKKLGNEMNTNNSKIKPSNNLNVVKLPTLLKIEQPQVDMTHIPGVPQWNRTDESDNDKQQSINGPKPQANNLPKNPSNNTKTATSNPPNPIQPTKEQADKEQQNPPAGPEKSPAGSIKPPKPQEGGGNGKVVPSIGEAGEEETNEKESDDDDDDEDDDEEDQNKAPKKPSENKLQDVDELNNKNKSDNEQTEGGINNKKKKEDQIQAKKPFLKRNFKIRSSVSKGENESESGSGASENKEINEILDSMNQE